MKKKSISKKNSCKKCKIVKRDILEMVDDNGELTNNFYNLYRHKDLCEGKGSFKLEGFALKHRSFLRPHTNSKEYNIKHADTYTEPIGHISFNGQMKVKNGKIIYRTYDPEQLCNIFIDRPQLHKTTYSVHFLLTNFLNIYRLRKSTGENYHMYHNLFSGNHAIDQSEHQQKLLLQIKSLSKFKFLENTIANIVDIEYDGNQWTFTLDNIYSNNEASNSTNPWLKHPDINKKRHHHFLETADIFTSGTFGSKTYHKNMSVHDEEADPQDIENTTYLYKGDIFTKKKMREEFKNIYLDKLVDTDEWHNCSFEITFIGWLVAAVEAAVDIAVAAGTALAEITTSVISEVGVTASTVVNSLGGLLGGSWGAGAVVADAAVETAGATATEVAADDAAASLSTEFAGDITTGISDTTEEAAQTALDNNELVDETTIENSVTENVDNISETETPENSNLTAKEIVNRVINYVGYLGYANQAYSLVDGIIKDNWVDIAEAIGLGIAGSAYLFSSDIKALVGVIKDSDLVESITSLQDKLIGSVVSKIGLDADQAVGLVNALSGIYGDYGAINTTISDVKQIEDATQNCFQLTNPNPGEGCTNLPLSSSTITNTNIQTIINTYNQSTISATDYNTASTSKNNFYKSALANSGALKANLSLLNKWLASITPNSSTITLPGTIQIDNVYNTTNSSGSGDWNNSSNGTENITIDYNIGNNWSELFIGVQNGPWLGTSTLVDVPGTPTGYNLIPISLGSSGLFSVNQYIKISMNSVSQTGTFTIDNVTPGETWMFGYLIFTEGTNTFGLTFGFQLPSNISNNTINLNISDRTSNTIDISLISLGYSFIEPDPLTTMFNNYKNKNVSAMINTIINGLTAHKTALTKQMFYGNKTGTKIMCGTIPTANTANGAALMNLQPNNTTKSVTFWPVQYTGESNGYLYLNNSQGSMVAVNIYFLNESNNPNVNKPVQYEDQYILACGIPNGGGNAGYTWGAIYQEENSNTFYLAGSGEAGQSLDLSSYDTSRYTNEPDSIGNSRPVYIYYGDLIKIFNLYDIQTEQGAALSYYKNCELNDSNNPPTILILTKLNQLNTYSSTLPVGKFPNTLCTS